MALVAALSLLSAGPVTARLPAPPQSFDPLAREHIAGSLLVRLRGAADAPFVTLGSGDTLTRMAYADGYIARVDAAREREALARLLADPQVRSVEPNGVTRTQLTPNDPDYGAAYWAQRLNLEAAWETTVGLPSAVIAVLDTGVSREHPDLQGRLLPGYNFVANIAEANDTSSAQHGTAVAMLAAARGNNATGMAGVAWNARVLPVRISDDNGNGTEEWLANGIRWAVNNGATVINISVDSGPSALVTREIRNATARNVTIVAAAGNTAAADSAVASDPQVIAVGATDTRDAAAPFTSAVNTAAVAAPGVDLRVSLPEKGNATYSGTSFAAPLVAGTVALMQSVRPGIAPDAVRAILTSTARDVGPPGPDAQTGAGIVDAARAVQTALARGGGALAPADPVYATYARDDGPVRAGTTPRGFIWGPQVRSVRTEAYADAPSGVRQVWYFDKGRLELNDPQEPQVTSGLLAAELISGRVQTGIGTDERRLPAAIPAVGDMNAAGAVTYATLNGVRGAPPRIPGAAITEELRADGTRAPLASVAGFGVTAAAVIPQTNHAVASVFWEYLTGSGTVMAAGTAARDPRFDPTLVVGLPITEAYWTTATVGGVQKMVLVQAFERRVLTYTPANPDGYQVEMGNTGLHYLAWRYGGP